jgi:hypothetical protein
MMFSASYQERSMEEVLFTNRVPRLTGRQPTLQHFFPDELRTTKVQKVAATLREAIRRAGGGALEVIDVTSYSTEREFFRAIETCKQEYVLVWEPGALDSMAKITADQF